MYYIFNLISIHLKNEICFFNSNFQNSLIHSSFRIELHHFQIISNFLQKSKWFWDNSSNIFFISQINLQFLFQIHLPILNSILFFKIQYFNFKVQFNFEISNSFLDSKFNFQFKSNFKVQFNFEIPNSFSGFNFKFNSIFQIEFQSSIQLWNPRFITWFQKFKF